MVPPRDPEATRNKILQVAADEMAEKGFKEASLSEILNKSGVSKGALYHHFSNKQELGYAVFDEVFVNMFLDNWNIPMTSDKPVEALAEWFQCFATHVTIGELRLGCPVHNIATEMCNIDEGFRLRILKMFDLLEDRLANTLESAQKSGEAKQDLNAKAVSKFIVASFQGMSMQGKYAHDIDVFKSSIQCMADYIRSLKK